MTENFKQQNPTKIEKYNGIYSPIT